MIAIATVELSDHVSQAETILPLTVDGKLGRFGIGAGTRGTKFRAFADSLREILTTGILIVEIGSFSKRIQVSDLGSVVPLDLPSVSRGEEIRFALSVEHPPACPVILTLFVEIDEDSVKPDLN
jgi:hypothetical protein